MLKKKKKIKCEMVRVAWIDAYEELSGWHEPSILNTIKCSECISYGLLYKRKNDLVLFADIAKDISSDVGRITCIPKAWVKDIKYFGIYETIEVSKSLE